MRSSHTYAARRANLGPRHSVGRMVAVLLLLVAAPGAHALDGLVSWGWDGYGQVSDTPAGTFSSVAAGGYFSVAIRPDGTLVSWGNDRFGQVSGTPGGTFSSVAAGYEHAVAIRTDGTLVDWGSNEFGALDGTPTGTFAAVAAGGHHSVAIRTDGTLVSWGLDAGSRVVSGTPTGTFSAVATGVGHSVAIRSDGTLVSWGRDAGSGVLTGTPTGTFTAVAAGRAHSLAIRTDGTLVSWGEDHGYNGNAVVSGTPAGTFLAVAAGWYHSLAIRTDGALVAWGWDDYGQVSGFGGGTIAAVSGGTQHSVALALPNTHVGSDVEVQPHPDTTITFDEVTSSGLTTVTTSTGGPPPPSGFRLGTPPTYYEISTTATYAGLIEVCIDYTDVSYAVESNLKLLHNDGLGWVDVTSSLDTTNNIVCGVVSSLSPFIVVEPDNQPPVITCGDPLVLWSPDHALVDVRSAFSIDDPDDDPVSVWIRVFSDETETPDTGDGTGRHAPDFKTELASGAQGLFFRSERRAAEDGRFYIILITADDGNGGVTTATCVAAVCPHDQTQESLNAVLAQAIVAAAVVQAEIDNGTLPAPPYAPSGLNEHGLSEPLGPIQ